MPQNDQSGHLRIIYDQFGIILNFQSFPTQQTLVENFFVGTVFLSVSKELLS